MRPLEFNGVIGRTQDFSQLKQSEDSKPVVMQQQITESITKQVETKSEQVYQNKDMDLEYDASREGNGTYEKNEQKRKKKKEEDDDGGKVIIKGRANFDVKI